MPPATELETARLALRRPCDDDAEFFVELLNQPSFLRYIGDKGVRTAEDARKYLRDGPLASHERHGFGLYLVELKESGQPIGISGLLKRDYVEDPDIGFAFLPPLVPPADAPGQVCVQGCEAKKATCQADCQARYQVCAKGLEPQVKTRYAEALKHYELDLKQYAAALRHYEMQLRFEWLSSYPFHPPYWWDPWPWPYSPPPYRDGNADPGRRTCATVEIELSAGLRLPARLRCMLRWLRRATRERDGLHQELPA